MANLNITNTFVAGTTAQAAQINTNFTDVKTWLNNRDNATDYWLNMKVLATTSNPAEIKSTAADCEFDIDCTGTNGTPRISWRRSGSTYFTTGVDGADNNFLKFGTTALTSNIAFQIPTIGAQIQLNAGTEPLPSGSYIGDPDTGDYHVAANTIGWSTGGQNRLNLDTDLWTVTYQDYGPTSTIVGWSSFTLMQIYYKKVGKTVFVYFNIDGTSNSTTSTFTLPFTSANTIDTFSALRGRDNNAEQTTPGAMELDKNSNTAKCFKDWTLGSTGWTASARKIVAGQFSFQVP